MSPTDQRDQGHDRDNPSGRVLGALTAERDPTWLNMATIRGALLVAVGAIVIATPNSDRAFRVAIGLAILGWAIADVMRSRHDHDRVRLFSGIRFVAVVGIGLSFVLLSSVQISEVIGAALMVAAALGAIRYTLGNRDERSRGPVLRMVVAFVAGSAMLFVPDTTILAVRALAGSMTALLGIILLRVGLGANASTPDVRLDVAGAPRLANQWLLDQRMDSERSAELADTLYFEAPRRVQKLTAFWVMMALATSIAAFAVVQDSTAVVIGAMLVAPLMTPIMGIAAAAVNGWAQRIFSSLALTASAVLAAIALSWLVAAWLPSVGNLLNNTQVTSRVEPTLLDLCIALAAGAAGAYATVNPRVSSSLSGVAIAVALVPPLAVVGLTLEQGLYSQSVGAFLLFLTNFVCIVLASSLVFVLAGFAEAPPSEDQRHRLGQVLGSFLTVGVIIAVPLSLTTQEIWSESAELAAVERELDEWIPEDEDLTLVESDVDGDVINIVLTGSSELDSVDDLEERIADATDRSIELRVRLIPSLLLRAGG